MGKLTVSTFVSLDGVMQAPGGPGEDKSGGFKYGGWTFPYFDDQIGSEYIVKWFSQAGAFLLGRKTYQIFAAHWPRFTDPNDPIAMPLNSLPKYVPSKTLKKADWEHTTILKGNIVNAIKKLKETTEKELQVHGSSNLLQTLLKHHLIDEYRIMTFPVVLGKGKRLFGPGTTPGAMQLIDSKTTPSGVVIQVYQPAGPVKTGSFALD